MKKFELTQEQIKEVYKNHELLKELFPEAFLEAGKWYLFTRNTETILVNFSGDYSEYGYPLCYGFGYSSGF